MKETMLSKIRIATRKSPLALWQAEYIKQQLNRLAPHINIELLPITTEGDKLLGTPLAVFGGKGLFVKELEQALLNKQADLAVHSMKDVTMFFPEGLILASICEREDPRDAFISNLYKTLDDIPSGAVLGTASLRRQSILKHLRPDLQVACLRGNVNSRLARLDQGEFAAIILASAGMSRLGFFERINDYFDPDIFIPAVGQGAIGIECRGDDNELIDLLKKLNHTSTEICVMAERAMNEALMGGCQTPVAAYAKITNTEIVIKGLVGKPDGSLLLKDEVKGPIHTAEKLGIQLAQKLIKKGAQDILKDIYTLNGK
ncbi:MAG: Porphobilinogen deaminase [Legionellaceae bacterium]